ncbi:CoA transferase [Peterkaempfera sp. SMS 1(5)a]|uniref:CoA transferase n=1 Tax=Peterkaempfera podocarpi TaxID=3232308 RepID=UPI00366DA9CB
MRQPTWPGLSLRGRTVAHCAAPQVPTTTQRTAGPMTQQRTSARPAGIKPATSQVYETADGRVRLTVERPGELSRLLVLLGREDLVADPRFGTPAARAANRTALVAEVARELRGMPAEECCYLLYAADLQAEAI